MSKWIIQCLDEGTMKFIWEADTQPDVCPRCGSSNITVEEEKP